MTQTEHRTTIVSNDTITMKPSNQITSTILRLIISISEKAGKAKANHLTKPS